MAHRVLSYTAIKQYEKCPRQFKEVRIDKRYPYEQNEEAKWGEYVHKQIENAIVLDADLPTNVSQYAPLIDAVKASGAAGWRVWCETTFAITQDGKGLYPPPSEFVWANPAYSIAGNIDLLMVSPDNKTAIIADWKTNKSSKYAEPEQLELYALGVMLSEPQVEFVSCSLIFLCDGYKLVKSSYTRGDIGWLMDKWKFKAAAVQTAIDTGHFPEGEATPLCGWCPCVECDNWQQGQDFRERKAKRRK